MAYVWMTLPGKPKVVSGALAARAATAGEFTLVAQPKTNDGGEFVGCQASVLANGYALNSTHIPPEDGDSTEAVMAATLLRAQSWCELVMMVMAYGALAPADADNRAVLLAWINAVDAGLAARVSNTLTRIIEADKKEEIKNDV